jgi:hypothetical protein
VYLGRKTGCEEVVCLFPMVPANRLEGGTVMNRKLLVVCLLGLGITQPIAAQVAAPSNTNAVPVSESRVDVSWRDNSTNESGFELYRSASGVNGVFSLVARAAPGATAHGDVGLNPSTQYCYKVRAVATMGGGRMRHSDFSKSACATTAALPAQPGNIHITTATTGFDVDVNGYLVRVDTAPDQPLGTNASVTIAGVAAGEHMVRLGDVASNCSVEGANPRAVSVAGGATTEVLFAVTCGPGPAIELTTLTTGANLDADGYGLMLWQRSMESRILAASAGVPANGSVRFFGLAAGEYDLEVNGIAANCMQINSLPPVDLTSGGMVSLALNVSCALPPGVTCSVEICDNGNDDDCDGLVDWMDPECQSACLDCSFDRCPPGAICGYDGCCVLHCGDGQWNGTEGDVDCGGDCAVKCQAGQHCWTSSDCASGVCSYDRCQ